MNNESLKLASWNVHGLREHSKTDNVLKELDRVDILLL